ncbi:MAG TPA: S41 family peptidase [Dokdonella sp.]|nr:S41 family peptidase [Dokdonella sp.]
MQRTFTIALLGAAVAAVITVVVAAHGRFEPAPKDMHIDAARRAAVVESAVALLDRSYVYPDKAALIERSLRQKLHDGDFDRIDSAVEFADALTDALRAVSDDQHLEVRYMDAAIPEPASDQDVSAEDAAAESIRQQRFNFGFAELRRLHGNIGYLDLHQFGRPQGAYDRIAAAMTLLGDTSGLIIDLRNCGGGDPESVMRMASYLFDRRTHLNDIYWREEDRIEQRWTEEDVPGRKYGSTRPLYLLTSHDTFSGGEDFAYALKNAGRATLVGETTGGGAHPGNPRRVDDHFMMFVPSGRPISPVTHADWEGVGVVPDVPASADKALDIARIAILRRLVATETDADWREKLQQSIEELE